MGRFIHAFPPNARPYDPQLGEEPAIDPSAQVFNCELGAWTEIGPRSHLSEGHPSVGMSSPFVSPGFTRA
jgi:hypothetical protein